MSASKAYEVVTDRIVALLEQGTAPWRRPWRGPAGAPRNLLSGKSYRGVNAILLGALGFTDPRFLTFKQAQDRGGCVRKGERGFPVVFFTMVGEDKAAGKHGFPLLRWSTNFNIAQTDGVEADPLPELPPPPDRIAACEALAAGYPGGPPVRTGGMACYRPSLDEVEVPDLAAFGRAEDYYATLFHELAHSTGHSKRLARKGITDNDGFGNHLYSKEELVAECTATFLCSEVGIDSLVIEDSAAYLAHWVKVLRGDPKLIMEAASAGQKAADHVLGREAQARQEVAA